MSADWKACARWPDGVLASRAMAPSTVARSSALSSYWARIGSGDRWRSARKSGSIMARPISSGRRAMAQRSYQSGTTPERVGGCMNPSARLPRCKNQGPGRPRAMRMGKVAALLAPLLLLASTALAGSNYAPGSLDPYFTIDWKLVPGPRGENIEGFVYNKANQPTDRMRLSI